VARLHPTDYDMQNSLQKIYATHNELSPTVDARDATYKHTQ